MERAELAKACVEVEKAGGSVREFLAEQGCISPWGTWYRLQKEELHRKEYQITDGKRRENMARKITLEQKKKAVQIAIEGGDVLEYLRNLGSKNPTGLWWTIKNDVKAADPELYAKIPRLDGKHIVPSAEREAKREEIRKEPEGKTKVNDMEMTPVEYKPEAVEPVLTIRSEEILKAEEIPNAQPEGYAEIAGRQVPVIEVKEAKMAEPMQYVFPGFTVTSVRGNFGEWHLDEKHDSLDFRSADGDEICFRPAAWIEFMTEIRAVMQMLGVKIDKNEDKTA